MAIVKVEKFNLIIFKEELNALLREFQKFNEIDFRISDFELKNNISRKRDEVEDTIYKLENILRKLKKYSKEKSSFKKLKEGKKEFSYEELENYVARLDILDIVEKINSILNEKEYIQKHNENILNEIKEYKKWENLDLSYKDLSKIKQVDVFLGTMSNKNFDKFKEEDLTNSIMEILYEDKKEVNFIIFANKDVNIEEKLRIYNFSKIALKIEKLPKDVIDDYENKINNNLSIIEKYDEELEKLSENIENIEISYEYYRNLLLREETKEKFKNTDKLNVITGYIPSERSQEFIECIEKVCDKDYYISYEEFDENSRDIPIKLKNNAVLEPFETLTATYSLPKYKEIDPTLVVAPFFWIFFGMMLADFGYGLIISVLSLGTLLLFNLDKSLKSILKFLFMLGISTMIWGALYGSFLGYDFDNPLHLFSPTQDYKPVMFLSIGIGVIHIFLALGVKAYILIRDKKYYDAIFDVGFWITTLISLGLFMFGKNIGLSENNVSLFKYIMIVSMLLIIATGGREAKSIGGKVGMGVYALYGISGYLGDLISYVRLMALALSGGYIAYAVNMIASMIGAKGIMFIFMILIMIIGHSFNMLLSILGAYVHTSRLIYVEFFGKFYEGGGKPFKDFKIKEKYINIKEEK